jgi:hypothetical protein
MFRKNCNLAFERGKLAVERLKAQRKSEVLQH